MPFKILVVRLLFNLLFERWFHNKLKKEATFLKNDDETLAYQVDLCQYYLESYFDALEYLNIDRTIKAVDEFKTQLREILM